MYQTSNINYIVIIHSDSIYSKMVVADKHTHHTFCIYIHYVPTFSHSGCKYKTHPSYPEQLIHFYSLGMIRDCNIKLYRVSNLK